MNRRHRFARTLTALGGFMLFASACVHGIAYATLSGPIGASNLRAPLQAVFRISFLAMAWHWIVLGSIVLLCAFAETRLRRALVLICGVAVLAETALAIAFVGLFIGDEMIGTAALLIVCGGLLFDCTAPPKP